MTTDADRLAREQEEIRARWQNVTDCEHVFESTEMREAYRTVRQARIDIATLLDQLAAERQAREKLEQALTQIAANRPKGEKPQWGDGHGGCNLDDAESNGYDICAWGNADIAEVALLPGAGEQR